MKPVYSTKIRKSAEGQECTFRIEGICNRDNLTTVFCHGPDHTRGKAQKTNDSWGAYGCSACHYALDHKQVDNPEIYWISAIRETQDKLIQAGFIIVAATSKKQKHKANPLRPRLYTEMETE